MNALIPKDHKERLDLQPLPTSQDHKGGKLWRRLPPTVGGWFVAFYLGAKLLGYIGPFVGLDVVMSALAIIWNYIVWFGGDGYWIKQNVVNDRNRFTSQDDHNSGWKK